MLKAIGDLYCYMSVNADHHRRMPNRRKDKERSESNKKAQKCYEMIHQYGPCPVEPFTLKLYINWCYLLHNDLNDSHKAETLAFKAFENCLDRIDEVSEDTFREIKPLIEALKEIISLCK